MYIDIHVHVHVHTGNHNYSKLLQAISILTNTLKDFTALLIFPSGESSFGKC